MLDNRSDRLLDQFFAGPTAALLSGPDCTKICVYDFFLSYLRRQSQGLNMSPCAILGDTDSNLSLLSHLAVGLVALFAALF